MPLLQKFFGKVYWNKLREKSIVKKKKTKRIYENHITTSYRTTPTLDNNLKQKEYETTATMADEEVLFDDVYELCEIIGKWVSRAENVLITLKPQQLNVVNNAARVIIGNFPLAALGIDGLIISFWRVLKVCRGCLNENERKGKFPLGRLLH